MRLIDADKLVNSLENNLQSFEEMISEHGKGIAHGTRIALGLVKEQPTISPENPQPQWIPVTERMPREHQIVVGWTKDNPFSCYREEVVTWNGKGWVFVYAQRYVTNVKYWMPLPEPYTLADVKGDDNAQRVKPVEFYQFKNDTLKDVQPVVHGKWEPVRYTTHCSCGKSYETYHFLCTACNHVAYAQPYGLKYCPHCGARMDKEVNDDD